MCTWRFPLFRWLRWHLAKRRFASSAGKYPPARHVRISHQLHDATVRDFPPTLEGYSRLAARWDEYAWWFVPDYARFLIAAGDYYGQPVGRVLDLACGTGVLTRRLAEQADWVVGLDASQAMLREARSLTEGWENVQYVRGDFRDFSLDAIFDACVCGGDSLNYVEAPKQIAAVFRAVHRHLRPGGLFLFDSV